MAKRQSKIDIASYETDFVSNEEKIIEDIIKPAIEDHLAGKVKDLRSKGFDDNRIAAMLMINVNKVKDIK